MSVSETDDTGSASRETWEIENDKMGSDGDASRGSDGAQADGSDVDYGADQTAETDEDGQVI